MKVSSLGVVDKGYCPLLEQIDNLNKSDWPIPKFQKYDSLSDTYYAVDIDEDLKFIN